MSESADNYVGPMLSRPRRLVGACRAVHGRERAERRRSVGRGPSAGGSAGACPWGEGRDAGTGECRVAESIPADRVRSMAGPPLERRLARRLASAAGRADVHGRIAPRPCSFPDARWSASPQPAAEWTTFRNGCRHGRLCRRAVPPRHRSVSDTTASVPPSGRYPFAFRPRSLQHPSPPAARTRRAGPARLTAHPRRHRAFYDVPSSAIR
jgi:hypothetical protein